MKCLGARPHPLDWLGPGASNQFYQFPTKPCDLREGEREGEGERGKERGGEREGERGREREREREREGRVIMNILIANGNGNFV